MTPGPVFVKRHARKSKHDPLVDEAELIEANPEYAYVRLKSGHETTVSLCELAPCRSNQTVSNHDNDVHLAKHPRSSVPEVVQPSNDNNVHLTKQPQSSVPEVVQPSNKVQPDATTNGGGVAMQDNTIPLGRDASGRSTRISNPPQRYGGVDNAK